MSYKSYRDEVEKAMAEAMEISLEAVGLEAQRDVTMKVTDNRQVDTGRMRASVTYVAGDRAGKVQPDNHGITHSEDNPNGSLPKNTLQIGTNVEYAPRQEKINPFLAPTIKNNMSRYTDMFRSIYSELMRK